MIAAKSTGPARRYRAATMPSLRVVTWNSGGEAGGRGATLAADVTTFNATAPAVDLVATQEAKVGMVPPGSIYAVLNAAAAPFVGFSAPPNHPRERNPATQPYGVGVNRSYLVSWKAMTGGGAWLNSLGAAALVPLRPVLAPANGVETYIANLGLGPAPRAALRLAAANIRPPVRKRFTFPGAGGGNVFFYTWHAELQANWLNATWATVGLGANPFTGPGMYPAFQFFQACDTFTADMAAVTVNDILVIAGDLNIHAGDLAQGAMFPLFQGVSNNLSHILAYSLSGNLQVVQAMHTVTPYPPHAIVSAEVQW